MAERTPEEREAARLQREAQRAKKSGETSESAAVAPVDPVRYDPVDFIPEPDEPEQSVMGEAEEQAAAVPDPGEPTVEHTPDFLAEEEQPPEPVGERPLGVKRLGKPGVSAGSGLPVKERRGVAGSYQRYKAKPRGIPKRGRGLKRKGPIVLLVLALILLWFLFSLLQPLKGDGSGNVTVTIPQGSTNGDISEILADEDVIGSKFFFGLRLRLSGATLQSGTFELKKDMSFGSAIDALSESAKPATTKVVMLEGRARSEAARTVKDAGLTGNYETASRRSSLLRPSRYGGPRDATLEGFLFPATYDVQPGSSAKRLVNDQLRAFKTNFATVDMREAKRKNLTAFDVLTIASIVERETAVASERRKVAAVIYNRLKQGMRLQIDATVRFAADNWESPIKQSELKSTSPYNTYTHDGLPPGPIGSPGLASIKAAANPTSDDYLFYVVKPCGKGTHNFSSTEAQRAKNTAAYNAARERNGGNDPSNAKDC